MEKYLRVSIAMSFALGIFAFITPTASADTTCTFATTGTTMSLNGDCETDEAIEVPDGFTLNGNGYTITATNPGAGFKGAVVTNAGSVAHVTNLVVVARDVDSVCESSASVPDGRLRGIWFNGASGSITNTTIDGVYQTSSARGCQEGYGIEVSSAPFDGTHPDTKTVEITGNTIRDFQKSGIYVSGDVLVTITNNDIGESIAQSNLAANSVLVGFGASGTVSNNTIAGNQWLGASDTMGTAVLIYEADEVSVTENLIIGNSDVGIYVYASEQVDVTNNRISDDGADESQHGYDSGIMFVESQGTVANNRVAGFDTPFEGDIQPENPVLGPVELCANRWNGATRWSDSCTRSETLVEVSMESPSDFCVNTWTGLLRFSQDGSCARTETAITLPDVEITWLCVDSWSGSMRVTDSACGRNETREFI